MKLLVLFTLLSFNLFAQEEESEYLRALRLSCEKQKVALGCFNYANSLARSGNEESAEKYYGIGCKLDHSPSCKKEKWDLPELEKPVAKTEEPKAAEEPEAAAAVEPEAAAATEPEAAAAAEPEAAAATEPEAEAAAATEPEAATSAEPEAAAPESEPAVAPEDLDLDLDTGNTINE